MELKMIKACPGPVWPQLRPLLRQNPKKKAAAGS